MLRSAKSVKRTQLELSLVCQTNWATSENISSEHTFNLYSILFFFSRAKYFRVLAKFLFSFYLGYQRSLFSLWVSKLKHFQTRPNLNPFLLFPHFIICPMFSDFSISFLFDSVSFRLEYFIFSPCCRFPAPPRFSADVQLVTCWSRSYDVCSTPETKTYSTFPVVQDRFILSSLLSSPSLWHMIRRANWTFIMQIRARPRSSSARIPGKKPVKTCRGTSLFQCSWIELNRIVGG